MSHSYEADVAFLLPSDRHGQETLNRRLKDDLSTFKGLIENGELGHSPTVGGASSKPLAGVDAVSPASVAARIRRREHAPRPGAGWDTDGAATDPTFGGGGLGDTANADLGSAADLRDVLPPARRIGAREVRGSAAGAGTHTGTAPMGGHTPLKDLWGDGMV